MKLDYTNINGIDQQNLDRFAGAAYSSRQGVQHTFLLAVKAISEKIPGVFVECGVASGALAAAMGYALLKHGEQYRGLHLCDSFEGIPLAGPNDHDQPGIGHHIADVNLPIEERLKSSGISVGTVDQVRNNFLNWGLSTLSVQYHKGWFQHTLPGLRLSLPPIALLRLDGDLYESTQCCLQNLYPLVSPGGIVILDDYPLPGSRKAFEEYFAGNLPEVFIEVDTGAAFWIKC